MNLNRLDDLQTKNSGQGGVEQIAQKIHDKVAEMREKQVELEDRLNGIEKKANRPGITQGGHNTKSTANAVMTKFIRKGLDGLDDLQQKAMSTTTGEDGGYAIPEIIAKDLENFEYQCSAVMRLANVVEAESGVYKKLVNLRGTGAGWAGETDARPNTGTPKLISVDIVIGEVYANPQATQQMLDDASFNVELFIAEEVGDKFADQLGAAFITGDGVNKPKGILSYANTNEFDSARDFGVLQHVVTSATGQVTFDDVKGLRSSLNSKYRQGAAFLMNETTALHLSRIKDSNGQYIWQESVAAGEPPTLLGYPVEIDENLPDIAAGAFPLIFGNLKRGYHIPKRFDIRMLRDPFTSKPYVNFYTTQRIGGGVVNSEAIKLLKVKA